MLPRAVRLEPGRLRGRLRVPGSKSHAHRAVLLALLAQGESLVAHAPLGDDVDATLEAAQRLGAGAAVESVEGGCAEASRALRIQGPGAQGLAWAPVLDARESGTTARLLAGVAALLDKPVTVTGRGRLPRRPVLPLLRGLGRLGARYIASNGCCPPYTVAGPTRGTYTWVDARESSQYLSALLIHAAGRGGLAVEATGLESRPYVEITVRVLQAYGVGVETGRRGLLYRVEGEPRPTRYRVPGDWSTAAQLLAVVAAAGGEVELLELDPGDPHPDRAVLDILQGAGAGCGWSNGALRCESQGPGGLTGFEACLRDSPDLGPALAAVAITACGASRLCCADRLRLKESDRVEAILRLAEAAGAEARLTRGGEQGLCIEIRGLCGPPRPAAYPGARDHRVAMAAAALALAARGPSTVLDAGSVAKSYPGFWEALAKLGARLTPLE